MVQKHVAVGRNEWCYRSVCVCVCVWEYVVLLNGEGEWLLEL